MGEALEHARVAYPPPWVIGWWERDGRWAVEVNRQVSYARFERLTVATGTVELRAAPSSPLPPERGE